MSGDILYVFLMFFKTKANNDILLKRITCIAKSLYFSALSSLSNND